VALNASRRSIRSRNHRPRGLFRRHARIEQPDYLALPSLVDQEARFGLVYIDGSHVFDHVIIDAFHSDLLLDVGGIMAFNDCWMPSVDRAIRFVAHYAGRELDVGLPRDFEGRQWLLRRPRGEDR
jgi:hypothetical protein